MEIRQPVLDRADLQALTALGAHGHFARAAEALGISQPALTKRIRNIEQRMGGPLFDRHPRGATATAAGRLLCERASVLLDEALRSEAMARQLLSGNSGVLRAGAGLTVLLRGLPQVVREFRKEYPEVQVTLRDMSTQDQVAALRNGDIDIGFLRMPTEAATGLRLVPLMKEELRIACQPDVARKQLFRQPLVIVSRTVSPTFHDHVLATCRLAGYAPPMVQEANELLTALMLVQAGVGISLVPAAVSSLRLPRVRILETSLPKAGWPIAIAWPSDKSDPVLVKRFARLAQQSLAGAV